MPPDIPEGNLQTRNFDLGCTGLDKLGKLDYLFNNGGVYKSSNSYESTHKPSRNTYTPPSFNFSPPPPNNVSGDNGTFSNFDKDVRLLLYYSPITVLGLKLRLRTILNPILDVPASTPGTKLDTIRVTRSFQLALDSLYSIWRRAWT